MSHAEKEEATDRDLQYRFRTVVQLNLIGEGSTFIRFRAETGRGFDRSWDNIGLGRTDARWNFNVKSFFIGQKIGSSLTFQAGGIEFDPGSGAQLLSASGDGHMVGYRLVRNGGNRPFDPDKLSLTMGFVNDFHEPSVFSRLDLGKFNYAQLLAQEHFGTRADASLGIDVVRDIWFARQAVGLRDVWGPLADELRLDVVQRMTHDPSFGWTATLSRHIDPHKRWNAYGIYAHVPTRLYDKGGAPVMLNQGEIDLGKHLAWGATYDLKRDLQVALFASRLLDHAPGKRWVAQLSVTYQYAGLLNRLIH